MNTSDLKEGYRYADDIEHLDIIQLVMENEISNYEITATENLYDEDEERFYRAFTFNRGVKEHQIVIHPECFIKATSKKTPSPLIVEISNALICCLYARK